jgi:hypothetical protein
VSRWLRLVRHCFAIGALVLLLVSGVYGLVGDERVSGALRTTIAVGTLLLIVPSAAWWRSRTSWHAASLLALVGGAALLDGLWLAAARGNGLGVVEAVGGAMILGVAITTLRRLRLVAGSASIS